jgi:hypothetical protein
MQQSAAMFERGTLSRLYFDQFQSKSLCCRFVDAEGSTTSTGSAEADGLLDLLALFAVRPPSILSAVVTPAHRQRTKW